MQACLHADKPIGALGQHNQDQPCWQLVPGDHGDGDGGVDDGRGWVDDGRGWVDDGGGGVDDDGDGDVESGVVDSCNYEVEATQPSFLMVMIAQQLLPLIFLLIS